MKRNSFPFSRPGGLRMMTIAVMASMHAGTLLAQSHPGYSETSLTTDVDVTLENIDPASMFDDCPDELLRQEWLEGQPLQTLAVEAEVLALCTERAAAIAEFFVKRAALDVALRHIQAPRVISVSGDAVLQEQSGPPLDSHGELLKQEIETLKDRITRLEMGPQHPETEERINELQGELEIVENELAIAESLALEPVDYLDNGVVDQFRIMPEPAAISPKPKHDSANVETVQPVDIAESDDNRNTVELKSNWVDQFRENIKSARGELAEINSGQPVISDVEPIQGLGAASAATSTLKPLPMWNVLYAVRSGNGPWKVGMQSTHQIAITVPGLNNENAPSIEWQTTVNDPVTVAVNDTLSDGRILLAVDDRGIIIGNSAEETETQHFIPFRTDTTPGMLEWSVIKETPTTENG